jgi:hypothetical protein
MNYGQLKSNIAAWLHREDLSTVIPTFVALAEADIRRTVRVRAMETRDTGTTTGTITLGDDFIQVRQFIIGDIPLLYSPPQEWHTYNDNSGKYRYTIIGDTLYSAAGSYQLDYWAAFDALSADGDTNWLLTNAPDVYLFAALKQAAIYTRDDAMAQQMAGEYMASVRHVMNLETASRIGSVLQMRSEVVE